MQKKRGNVVNSHVQQFNIIFILLDKITNKVQQLGAVESGISIFIFFVIDPWAVTKKNYASMTVLPAPVWVPSQWPLYPSFTSVT